MIRILMTDDHLIVRHGLKAVLTGQADMEVIAEAGDGEETLKLLGSGLQPDVILIDIMIPGKDGISLADELRQSYPAFPIMMLTVKDDDDCLRRAFSAGVTAYVLKTAPPDELIFAVRQAAQQKPYLSPALTGRMINSAATLFEPPGQDEGRRVDLSELELKVLRMIADGYTNQHAAELLFTSRRTMEGYRQSIFQKTGTNNAAQLVRFAMRAGIIS